MADHPLSIEPVIKAIDDLAARIRTAKIPRSREGDRTRALNALQAAKKVLKDECPERVGRQEYFIFRLDDEGDDGE